MFDSWQSIVALVAAVLIAYAVVLWLGILVWTYRDVRERTHDGWSQLVSVALVALFNIPGLILYLVLRPHETLAEAYERRLEAEALMSELPDRRRSCPRCERVIKEEFLVCPYCRATLREPCLGCGRGLELTWLACPYCGAHGPQAVAAPGAPLAQQPAPQAARMPASAEQAPQPAPQAAGTGTPQAGAPGPTP